MGSCPLVPTAPDVAELSSISVFGCCGVAGGTAAGATDLSEALLEAPGDDAAVDEGVAVVEGVVLGEPEFATGEGEGSADGGVAGAVAGAGVGAVAGAVVDVFGSPEADLGSAVGCVWAESTPVAHASERAKTSRRCCIGS